MQYKLYLMLSLISTSEQTLQELESYYKEGILVLFLYIKVCLT